MKIKTSLLVAFLATGLCAAPAFAEGAMQANNPPSADSDQPVSDTWITTKVKADLVASDGVPGTDISVNTTNG